MNPVRFLSTLTMIALFVASTKVLQVIASNPNQNGFMDGSDGEDFDDEDEDENGGPPPHSQFPVMPGGPPPTNQFPGIPGAGGGNPAPQKKSAGSLSTDPPQHLPANRPKPPAIPQPQVTAEAYGTVLCGDTGDSDAIVELHGRPSWTHWTYYKPEVRSKLPRGECIGFGTTDAEGKFHIFAQKQLKSKRLFEVYVYTHCTYETKTKAFPPRKMKIPGWTSPSLPTRVYRLLGVQAKGDSPPKVDVGTVSVISHTQATRVNKIVNGDVTDNIIDRCYQMKEAKVPKEVKVPKKKATKKGSAPS